MSIFYHTVKTANKGPSFYLTFNRKMANKELTDYLENTNCKSSMCRNVTRNAKNFLEAYGHIHEPSILRSFGSYCTMMEKSGKHEKE